MKNILNHTDMDQDAGAIIKEINQIQKKFRFKIEVVHISRENGQYEFILDPH